MTIGIYALYWEEQDLIYIGLSQDIEGRYKEHLYNLRECKHTNYKVQNTYNLHGIPTLFIVEKCPLYKLNDKEVYWTKEFDSLNSNNGLNIVEAGQVGFGTSSNSSKYSKHKILKVFSLLYRTTLSHPEISTIVKQIPEHLISDIARGSSHLWLKDMYPTQYLIMRDNIKKRMILNRSNALTRDIKYPEMLSPEGNVYKVNILIEFCKSIPELSLNLETSRKCIGMVLHGSKPSYKGWRLVQKIQS